MRTLLALAALSLLFAAPQALAGGTLTLDASLEAAAPGECAALTKLKYPWLRCEATASGGTRLVGNTAANASWESDRRLPKGMPFVEGFGWWGSDAR